MSWLGTVSSPILNLPSLATISPSTSSVPSTSAAHSQTGSTTATMTGTSTSFFTIVRRLHSLVKSDSPTTVCSHCRLFVAFSCSDLGFANGLKKLTRVWGRRFLHLGFTSDLNPYPDYFLHPLASLPDPLGKKTIRPSQPITEKSN